MATFALPLSQDLPWYSFEVTLSQVSYTFEMRYNTRRNRWSLSILDSTEAAILVGLPLLINRDIVGQYLSFLVPLGTLLVLDDSGNNLQPTIQSFLTDHTLYYVEPK